MGGTKFTQKAEEIINGVGKIVYDFGNQEIAQEHLLYGMLTIEGSLLAELIQKMDISPEVLTAQVEGLIKKRPKVEGGQIYPSNDFNKVIVYAESEAKEMGDEYISVEHLFLSMLKHPSKELKELWKEMRIDRERFLQALSKVRGNQRVTTDNPEAIYESLEKYATDLVQRAKEQKLDPVIGRDAEIRNMIRILSRKTKNNPVLIGEPGVGKTAITYGLARLIEEDRVPEPLKNAKIFSLDLGSLIAGTQFRGDFEKRFKRVMDSISREEKPIVYIDEIHNIVGAGAVNGGSFDISNMLKPYLAAGSIRFIGATTYEEYKKHFEKSRSLVRRFQNIDIREPGIEDATRILEGLKKSYEKFHGVTYGKGVIAYAVSMSAKYVNERCLPDKAIDLIDEAGAYRRLHPLEQKTQTVGKGLIDEILSKTCQIPKQVVEHDEIETLATLEKRLMNRVYGQNEAIAQVVNAVKFSRAGLLEEGKPLASLLFVGPTGVGKTEIARSLADELGVKLIRFDMSEYEEKHAVAKLIGSPAGYVGYEEGGLLTEEIRKNPHAVLLLDEIEKAHPDIYNILLQVMDYATLTDNQGRKADFRNVIVIMTSNAGASRIGRHGIGFMGQDVRADVIMEEVKRIFQPEFRNRLNKIVVFHGMDDTMAGQITEKKLGELQKLLLAKKVELSVDAAAKKLLKRKGISTEFGAREIDRVIQGEIKPLLVDEILFGRLKKGGKCRLAAAEDKFLLQYPQEKGRKNVRTKVKVL